MKMLRFLQKAEPMLATSIFMMAVEVLVLRSLFYDSICRETYSDCAFLRNNDFTDNVTQGMRKIVQEKTSKFLSLYGFVITIPSIFVGLYFGMEADRGNFLKCWILSTFSYSLGVFITLIVVIFDLDTRYYYLAGLVKAFFGGEAILMMTSFAYISKTAAPDALPWRLILADTILSSSFILGTVFGGFVADRYQYSSCLIIVFGLNFITLLYPMLFLSDLPSQTPQPPISLHERLKSMVSLFHASNHNRKLLFGYLTFFIAIFFTFEGYYIVSYLFVSGDPFLMKNRDYSYVIFGIGVGSCLTGLLGAFLLSRKMIHLNLLSFVVSLVASGGYLTFGLAINRLMLYVGSVLASVFSINLANGKTILVALVNEGESGRLFALIFMARGISALVMNPLFLYFYSLSVEMFPGSIFCIFAGSAFIIGIVFLIPSKHRRLESKD